MRHVAIAKRIYQSLPQPISHLVRWIIRFLTGNFLWPHQRKHILKELCLRLGAGDGLSFWFLPKQTWFSTIFQRPQQMARALAEIGCKVVYCEPWIADWIASSEAAQKRRFVGVKDIAPQLHLLRCPLWMVRGFIRDASPDVLMMIWPDQDQFIPKDTSCAVVYEMVDSSDLVTDADERWHRLHREWIHRADVMVATADDLIEQLRSERPDALLLPNAVRLEDWVLTEAVPAPEDMLAARRAPVVVGYYGAIAEWFDWDLWEYAAGHKPDWAFVLIGPPYDGDVNKIKERVGRCKNMHYLGAKSYSSLPGYLAHFDVATIPFVLNNITHACSPLKLFEYMAAGKPIVAAPMREIIKYKSVLVADSPQAFVSQCERALTLRDDAAYRAILQQEAEANTWRARARALRQAIEAMPKKVAGRVC